MRKMICALAALAALAGCKGEEKPKLPQITYFYLETHHLLVHLDHGKAPGEICASSMGHKRVCGIHPGEGHYVNVTLARDGLWLRFPKQTPDYHLMNPKD